MEKIIGTDGEYEVFETVPCTNPPCFRVSGPGIVGEGWCWDEEEAAELIRRARRKIEDDNKDDERPSGPTPF